MPRVTSGRRRRRAPGRAATRRRASRHRPGGRRGPAPPARHRLPPPSLMRASFADDRIGRQAPEVEALRAADDGRQHLVGVGGGQDEDDVVGRLLDELEQRVERVGAQHVDLVDDVDPLAQLRRRGERPHHQVAGVLDQAVAGGVDLDHVQRPSLADRDAGRARVAWLAVGAPVRAVDRLGQDARRRGLPGPPRPDEQVGVRDPSVATALRRVVTIGSWPSTSRSAASASADRWRMAPGMRRRRGRPWPRLTVHRTAARSAGAGRGRNGRAPGVDRPTPRTRPSTGSSQVAPRHPKAVAYRCFLPDLTGFTDLRCVGPDSQRRVGVGSAKASDLGREFSPAVADCGYRAPLVPRLARPPAIVSRG